MSSRQKITTFLWFDGKAEEAANHYTSIFKNSKILSVTRYGDAGPGQAGIGDDRRRSSSRAGVRRAQWRPPVQVTEAISLQVDLRHPARGGRAVEQASAAGGPGRAVRLAEGRVRPVLANRPLRVAEAAARQGSREVEAGDASDASDEEAGRRAIGAGLGPPPAPARGTQALAIEEQVATAARSCSSPAR